ncbi:MAG: aminopeptidase [Proteobacteria bacterium]|nr:aminopeptidase [Pseudomonadota bacterium]
MHVSATRIFFPQLGIVITLKISRALSFFVAISLAFWLYGCTNLPYYAQAVDGQMEILRRAQPISMIVADPNADKTLKRVLSKVVLLREFASRDLKLPDNESYTSYADLKRPYVVWNVYATPEFSTELKKWCFVAAGCVDYRGFFSKEKAERFAEELKSEGYDVHVGGIRAYSTLGWFDDPVLNTFIGYSEIELARLIFHELAHQVVYVQDDSVFNESFATTVEQEGVKRWLESNGTAEQQGAFDAKQNRETIFTNLILYHRKHLKELFSSRANDSEKRASKLHIFSELREEFAQLKVANVAFGSYDQWFALQLNNALLATVSTYTQLVPAFRTLLMRQGGDMERFYDTAKRISKLTEDERNFALNVGEDQRRDVARKRILVEPI